MVAAQKRNALNLKRTKSSSHYIFRAATIGSGVFTRNLTLQFESNLWRVPPLDDEAQKNRPGTCTVLDLSITVQSLLHIRTGWPHRRLSGRAWNHGPVRFAVSTGAPWQSAWLRRHRPYA